MGGLTFSSLSSPDKHSLQAVIGFVGLKDDNMQVHPSSCGTLVDADCLEFVVKDDAQSNVNIQVDWEITHHLPLASPNLAALAFTLMALKLKTETRCSFCSTVPPLQAAVGVVQQDLRPTIPKNTGPKLVELLESCWQQNPTWRPNFSEIMEMLQHMAKESDFGCFGLLKQVGCEGGDRHKDKSIGGFFSALKRGRH